MKSKLPYDNSLNGRFGMKSEPVNYSICNAVRIADTIINNRIVMQIISDKLILLFPQSKLQNILQNIDTAKSCQNNTRCFLKFLDLCLRKFLKGTWALFNQGSMDPLVQAGPISDFHWSDSRFFVIFGRSLFWYLTTRYAYRWVHGETFQYWSNWSENFWSTLFQF